MPRGDERLTTESVCSHKRAAIYTGLVLVLLSGSNVARAWTDTHVESAMADLQVGSDGSAEVSLSLRVGVHGGWLEGLEIAGLDADMELEGEVVFEDLEGTRFSPRVRRRDDGSVWLRFDRRAAPRRGEYTARLRYRTQLSPTATRSGELVRMSWTLPGWRSGLDGVEIRVRAPRGARLPPSDDTMASISRSEADLGPESVLMWRRAHIPRTTSWTVAFELPHELVTGPLLLVGDTEAHEPVVLGNDPAPAIQSDEPAVPAPPIGLLWALLLTTCLASRQYELLARRRGTNARPLLPLGVAARALLALLVTALSTWKSDHASASLAGVAALVLLGWQRTPPASSSTRLGAWHRITPAEPLGRAPRLRAFDASHPLGLVLAFSAVVLAWLSVGRPEGVMALWSLVVAIPWLQGVDARLPATLESKRARLLEVAQVLRLPAEVSLGLGLFAHRDSDGTPQDVRLRIVTPSRLRGLVRFDIVCGDVPGPGGLYTKVRVLVVVREGSDANSVAESILGGGFELPGGRIARSGDVSCVPDLARGFAAQTSTAPRPAIRTQRLPQALAQRPSALC